MEETYKPCAKTVQKHNSSVAVKQLANMPYRMTFTMSTIKDIHVYKQPVMGTDLIYSKHKQMLLSRVTRKNEAHLKRKTLQNFKVKCHNGIINYNVIWKTFS